MLLACAARATLTAAVHSGAPARRAFHCLASSSAFAPRLARAVVVPAAAAQPSLLEAQPLLALGGAVRWDSTKRKRAKKMNKHKLQKMRKRVKNLGAKNIS